MKKSFLLLNAIIIASTILITLGFKKLKEEKETSEIYELVKTLETSFDLLPFELSLEEKFEFIQNPKSIIEMYEKNSHAIPDAPDWSCASLCWSQFSNCWEGLSYYEQGSGDWIQAVDKCFLDVSKCFKKCRKEKNLGGPIQ